MTGHDFKMKKIFSSLQPIFFSIIIIILFFFLLEALFAFFAPQIHDNALSHYQLNHIWRPNSKFVHDEWGRLNPAFKEPYTHYYNSQSWLADHDFALKKPDGTYRIFFLGDSFIEGTCPLDQSVPSLVEKELRKDLKKSKYQFEVVNTGTASYSPLIHYINLRYFILKYQPDVVVINVDMTDDFDDWKYSQKLILDKDGDPFAAPPIDLYYKLFVDTENGPVKATWTNRAILFLYQHSHLYNWLLKVFHRDDRASKKEDEYWRSLISRHPEQFYRRWAWCRYDWDAETQKNVAFTMNILEKIIQLCQKHKVKLLLSATPYYAQCILGGQPEQRVWSIRPHEEIKKLADKYQTPYLDSIAAVEQSVRKMPSDTFYYNGDVHFNPRGYALWAVAYIKAFKDPLLHLLPDDCYRSAPADAIKK